MLFQPMLASAKCGGVDYSWGADALSNAHDFTVTMMLYVVYPGVCHSSHRRHHRSFTNLYKDEYRLRDEYVKLRRERQKIESRDSMDETYRRFRYVRYADDFLIGVIGSKADCVKIKSDITNYMEENLKLELSQEKH